MSDRTSANLFGIIFKALAEEPDDKNKAIAKKIFPLRKEYDFNDYQMYCDEALIKLDLAKKSEDGVVQYADDGDDA